jgi:tetratricopeptide (TPR) repeat protein
MALPSFCLRVKSPSVASSNGLDAVIAVAILGSQGWFGGDCESLCDSLEWQTTATHDHYFCFYDWACAMGCSSVTASQSGNLRIAACVLVVIALLGPVKLHGQSKKRSEESATLQGVVRDSQGHPLAAATVFLHVRSETRAINTRTDSEGIYHFAGLSPGSYALRAEMVGYSEASFSQIVLGRKETKKIDLTLAQQSSPPQSSLSAAPKSGMPEFFDEPNFTVAGVTDPTNLGGHGSDTVVRNKEELAKATVSLGRTSSGSSRTESSISGAESSLRTAAKHDPANFDANYKLGELLVAAGKAREALPYLEQASRLNPGNFENAYELALACAGAGEYEHAGTNVRTLLARQDRAPQDQARLHHLLGDVTEKLGKPLEAVREYQRAAELYPSEPNFFDWGSELLMHRAPQPAIEVFAKGNRLFPRSVRILVGLGAAWYSQGSTERAILQLCQASDLSPDEPTPYLFLGRILGIETAQSELLVGRLRRFARLQPENAMANYYYAVSLWQRRKGAEDVKDFAEVKALLEKAVRLDPKLGAGYLQLGILYSEQKDYPNAISAYQHAVEATPGLEEAHYRLAQIYRQTGETSKALSEFQLYSQLSKSRAAEVERDHHEIQEFVYTLRDRTAASQQ